ncbi:MAG: hypothetical protein II863_04760 [Kiritimatiellae bacterium]|nr:hypothetical protein [Kiritimatiellia bacterium]
MSTPAYELECPGCHRQYRRSDIKTDRLVCPACGREVVALVSIGSADSERVIRDYFYPSDHWTTKWAALILGGLELIGFIYCVFVHFYWSLFAVLLFFGFGTWLMIVAEIKRRKVFKLFEKSHFDLEKGLEAHRAYMDSLGDASFIDDEIGKELEQNLRARFSAAGKVRTAYAANSEPEEAIAAQPVSQSELPPNECPHCHAPYKISDYSGKYVKCRRCGCSVEIINAVDDVEIFKLTHEYLAKLVKDDADHHKLMTKVCWSTFVLAGVFWLFSDSTGSFLRSWAVLPLYLGCVMRLWLVIEDKSRQHRRAMLDDKEFTLFDFEYAMKKDALGQDERRGLDEFKGALLNLYKEKGTSMKGKVLS